MWLLLGFLARAGAVLRCEGTDWTGLGFSVASEGLEIEPHVIEAAVNHISGHKGGVAGIYNRATYGPQKARAMRAWADHLLGTAPAKVVPLHAAAGAA
jgi:hypothetical protein